MNRHRRKNSHQMKRLFLEIRGNGGQARQSGGRMEGGGRSYHGHSATTINLVAIGASEYGAIMVLLRQFWGGNAHSSFVAAFKCVSVVEDEECFVCTGTYFIIPGTRSLR